MSFLLKDTNNNILAYVDGTYLFTDNINIKAIDGTVVANIYKGVLSFTWHMTIYNSFHPGADPRVLTLLASKKSFSEDTSSTDTCNSYVYTVGLVTICVGSIVGFIILAVLGYILWNMGCFRRCERFYDDNL